MKAITRLGDGLREAIADDPLLALVVIASAVAMAVIPLVFLVLGRTKWFDTRRGRTERRPGFASVVCAMLLAMGIPAIVLLMSLKSRNYDPSRYEFDPNQTISVLDQGRQYRTLKEADEAVREEQKRLQDERKALVDQVKQLDEAMLSLRSMARLNPAMIPSTAKVLDRLGTLHRSIGLDSPQQLLEELGTPEAIAALSSPETAPVVPAPAGGMVAAAPVAAAALPGSGLAPAERETVLATVPGPQKAIASLVPLSGLPAGWVVGGEPGRQLETFNAENMYEKINGRAESFLQYDVQGMAYAYFHPEGDPSSEAQVYVFDFANALKAFGKYSSEKPDELEPLDVGTEGYTSAGSVFFYADKFYVQIVTTSDDPALGTFAKDLARRISAMIAGDEAPATESSPAVASVSPAASTPEPEPEASPALFFKLLPDGPGRAGDKYAAQDVFAYSFLTDVFLADYEEGKATWQGFIRPYKNADEATAMLEKYAEAVQEYGGTAEPIELEGATQAFKTALDGLTDVFFVKGNTLAGANGSPEAELVETFARAFATSLPERVPALPDDTTESQPVADGDGNGEQ